MGNIPDWQMQLDGESMMAENCRRLHAAESWGHWPKGRGNAQLPMHHVAYVLKH